MGGDRLESIRKNRVRTVALLWMIAALICAAALWLRPPCLIRLAFGVLCPACGTTHMVFRLLRLDFAGAFAENPLMFFLLPAAAVFAAAETVRYLRGKRALSAYPAAWAAFAAVTAIGIAFAVWRNLM